MRSCWVVGLLLTASIVDVSCSAARHATGSSTIKIMSFDIHHGEGADGKFDIDRIAKVILAANADIIALQSVDRGVARSNRIDIMTTLADLTGLAYAFGKTADIQGGDFGIGILSRFPILGERTLLFHSVRQVEDHGMLQLILEIDGSEIVLINTQLGDQPDGIARTNEVSQIRESLQQYAPRPIIVCGDFIDGPASATIDSMRLGFTDSWDIAGVGNGFTYPSGKPTQRVDYIFIVKNDSSASSLPVRPTLARVIQSDASSHLPVLSEFELSH